MYEKLRQYWIEKRFLKKKRIKSADEEIKNYPLNNISLQIIDGDESKQGEGPIEISFDKVKKRSDIMLDLEKADKEYIIDDAAYFEVPKEMFEEDASFYIYYGCKHRTAALFDRFFHRNHAASESFFSVIHLTGSR